MVEMKMKSAEAKKYSDFAAWLRDDLPRLPSTKPKIWSTFQKHAGFVTPLK
jgi:hypothetical protein